MAIVLTSRTQDVDEQASALSGWQQKYEQLGCGRFAGSAWQLAMDDGTMLRETVNLQHRQQVMPPKGQVVFSMALGVEPGSAIDGRPVRRESLIVFDGHAQHDVVSVGELELIGLSLDAV